MPGASRAAIRYLSLEALAAEGPDEAFHVGILRTGPGGPS